MFDNHRAPTIPQRADPPDTLPPRMIRIVALVGLVSLPLMLAAIAASAKPVAVLCLGLGQTVLIALIATLITPPAREDADCAASPRQRFTHG